MGTELLISFHASLKTAKRKRGTTTMKEQIDWKQEILDSANFNGKKEKILKELIK